MKKSKVVKHQGLCLLLIFLSIYLTGICQTAKPINIQTDVQKIPNFNIPDISTKVGDVLLSTGMEQNPPQISNMAVVAPDVLCIEIDECRILPIRQIPYIADQTDVVLERGTTGLGEKRVMYVVRNGFPLGSLVDIDRKTIMLFERIVGKHLNTNIADTTASYSISSPSDNNYSNGLKPAKVWRKTKPTNWTNTPWQLSSQLDKSQLFTTKHYSNYI